MSNDATESTTTPRFRFRLRTLLIAIGLAAAFFAGCSYTLRYMRKPRLDVGRIERDLRRDVPLGTTREDVKKYIDARTVPLYTANNVQHDHQGRPAIESWIMNTGSPGDVWPTDIRIQFVFDDQGRLVEITSQTVPRF